MALIHTQSKNPAVLLLQLLDMRFARSEQVDPQGATTGDDHDHLQNQNKAVRRSGLKQPLIIAVETAHAAPAPVASIKRNKISASMLQIAAQATLPAENATSPPTSTGLRPTRSQTGPTSSAARNPNEQTMP